MTKLLAAVAVLASVGLVYESMNADRWKAKADQYGEQITNLSGYNAELEVTLDEVLQHNAEIEKALGSRNTELRQQAAKLASQQEYIKELSKHDKGARDFINCPVPNSISCMFGPPGSKGKDCKQPSATASTSPNTMAAPSNK
ncbi:MAG: hypothetical protein CMB99_16350 [Flavobacteriaceae bacterium]|nr:hypothetical protein [Flavobacteriaceae bacterium]|tara:strand:- start:334 stop:762 length:429 start_codon:yes stop_codon:yes gene_type:complete